MKKLEITPESYTIIHFDEYPILFIGHNCQKEIIVGSFIGENDEDKLLYLYSLVTKKLAIEFLKRKLSYLELIAKASDIYILTKDYNEIIVLSEQLNFKDIDSSFLPLSTTYCPYFDAAVIELFKDKSEMFSAKKTRISKREKFVSN